MIAKILSFVFGPALFVLFFSSLGTSEKDIPSPIHQLRIYEVPKENIDVFHERFRDHAHRIMKKYDFHIVSTWESRSEEKVEFVYLLEWKNEQELRDAWAKFMEDREWKDIKKKTGAKYGSFVESIEDRTLFATDYSPKKSFLENQ